jgi:type IV secretory pathway TrbD component
MDIEKQFKTFAAVALVVTVLFWTAVFGVIIWAVMRFTS